MGPGQQTGVVSRRRVKGEPRARQRQRRRRRQQLQQRPAGANALKVRLLLTPRQVPVAALMICGTKQGEGALGRERVGLGLMSIIRLIEPS